MYFAKEKHSVYYTVFGQMNRKRKYTVEYNGYYKEAC